jgi:hypothetical protein
MTEEDVIALVPLITEPLTGEYFRNDREQINFILVEVFGPDKWRAYDALEDLRDLLADISELPEASGITFEEWSERRADFCRAVELYLEGQWTKPLAEKAH